MIIWINGERREVEPPATLAALLAEHGVPERGVAVAVDGEVVPRGRWHDATVGADARIEVLTAVQGG